MSSGERPLGAAKGKQSDTEALCQPPPPPLLPTLNQPPLPPYPQHGMKKHALGHGCGTRNHSAALGGFETVCRFGPLARDQTALCKDHSANPPPLSLKKAKRLDMLRTTEV